MVNAGGRGWSRGIDGRRAVRRRHRRGTCSAHALKLSRRQSSMVEK
jgi:hypothetical protein